MNSERRIRELEARFAELVQKSPKTQTEIEEKERVRSILTKAVREQAKPLFEELAEVGIRIESVWDLVNTSASYPEAVPILVRHLSEPYHQRNTEGIVRALAVKEAKGIANRAILEAYLRTPKERSDNPGTYYFRWTFGNTMKVIVTEGDLDDLIEIVLDETNGDSRDSFVEALAKLKSPRVLEVLKQLVSDKSKLVSQAAQKALKRKRSANLC